MDSSLQDLLILCSIFGNVGTNIIYRSLLNEHFIFGKSTFDIIPKFMRRGYKFKKFLTKILELDFNLSSYSPFRRVFEDYRNDDKF